MSISPRFGLSTTTKIRVKKTTSHGLHFESVVMEIRLDMILVDHSYQHPLDPSRAKDYAKHFDVGIFGIPAVNQRANGYYYIDGQHRIAAANMLPNPPLTIRCEVFIGLTLEQESWKFHEYGTKRKNLTPIELWVSAINAKEDEALAIDAAVRAAGMEVTRRSGPNNIQSVKSLYVVYNRWGGPMLTRVLSIMHTAWPAENDPCHHLLIVGMPFLLDREKELDDKRLIHVLSMATPPVVVSRVRMARASMSSSIAKAAGVTLTGLYNNGLRSGTRLGGDDDR